MLRFQSQFAALIRNQTDGLDVVPLLSAYQDGWLEVRTGPPDDEQAPTSMAVYPNSPEVLVPFPHERVAAAQADIRGSGVTKAIQYVVDAHLFCASGDRRSAADG